MTTSAEPHLQLDRPPPHAAERRHPLQVRRGTLAPVVGEGADALPALLGWHATTRAAAPALRHKTRGGWTTWSWGELAHEVACLALGLDGLGFGPDDVLALLGQTSPRQLALALAAQARGGAVLPVGDALDPAGVVAAVRATEARHVFAFASDERQIDRILFDRFQRGTVPLAAIVFNDRPGLGPGYSELPLHAYESLRAPGERDSAGRTGDGFESIAPGQLPHRRPRHPEVGAAAGVAGPEDEALLIDPLSTRSGAAVLAHWLLSGFCLSCPETDGSAEEDRREVAPTYLMASTAWYTRLRHDTEARLPPPRSWRRRLIATALGRSARADAPPSSAARTGILGRQLDHLASALVARPLSRALGLGRTRVAVAVGEPLGAEDTDFLAAIGIATLHLPS
jgi:long-subunit acyl-CoA synthetase (AMP-forming)